MNEVIKNEKNGIAIERGNGITRIYTTGHNHMLSLRGDSGNFDCLRENAGPDEIWWAICSDLEWGWLGDVKELSQGFPEVAGMDAEEAVAWLWEYARTGTIGHWLDWSRLPEGQRLTCKQARAKLESVREYDPDPFKVHPLTATDSDTYNRGANILPDLLNGDPMPGTESELIEYLVGLGYRETSGFVGWGPVLTHNETGNLIMIDR